MSPGPLAVVTMAAAIGCAQKEPPLPPAPPIPFNVVATPKDDAQWLAVENNALALAESANLLMMEGRIVDHGNWMKQSKALLDTAITAAEAAHAKDAEKVMDAGNAIYEVCEGCHMQYMKQEQ